VNDLIVRSHRRKLLVLCYHGILRESREQSGGYETCLDHSLFRAQLRWLRQRFEPIDLAGLAHWHSGAWTEPKPRVLITFDDGYKNNVTVAAPILTQERFPAVFFLATGYIGTGRVLWNHEVRQRVIAWPGESIRLPDGSTLSLNSGSDMRRKLAEQINQQLKRLTEDACQEYQEYLRRMTPSASLMEDPEARAFMNWNDARTLVSGGFEIGSHTVDHPILSSIKDMPRLSKELRGSKDTLERELGKPCLALAYPNGTTQDVGTEVFQEARAAGYQWGFMTTPVWQAPGGDPYQLARIGVPGHADMPTFTFYVSGLHAQFSGTA